MRLCIIEDNDALRDTLCHVLSAQGFEVAVAADGVELDGLLRQFQFDAYIIDLNLPGEDGLSIATRLKHAYPDCFVIMATARERVADRTLGYQTGADIYMTKPVDFQELIAALHGIRRRWSSTDPARNQAKLMLRVDHLALQNADRSSVVQLTPTEALILKALAEAPRQQLEYWQLLEWLDKPVTDTSKKVLEVHAANLRRKLLSLGVATPGLRAVRGVGYALLAAVSVVHS
jgi:DNA-binding response OmpR family regulator